MVKALNPGGVIQGILKGDNLLIIMKDIVYTLKRTSSEEKAADEN